MTDLIRDMFYQYEQRMTDATYGLDIKKLCLDDVVPGEELLLRIEVIAYSIAKSQEQIFVGQETLRELYGGLDRIGVQEQVYLLYHYSFINDIAHTMIEKEIHFNLSESRAKKNEE